MRRREFIKAVAGSAAADAGRSLRARSRPEQMRRVGILANGQETDAEIMARLAAFRKGLQELGWGPERIYGSIPAMPSTTISCVRRRRNWSGSRRTLFWLWRHLALWRC